MATFFSTSTDQRGLAAGGGGGSGDMSFHHYPTSNTYPDSSTGGLIPLPATIMPQCHIAHGGDGRDEPAAFMSSRDGQTSSAVELGGLQTRLSMGDGASSAQRHHGLSLSLGGAQVPVSVYQYRPGGMVAAAASSLLSPNQPAMAASRNAQANVYVQSSRFLRAARELLDEVVSVRDAIKTKGDRSQGKADDSGECGKGDAEKGEEHEGNSSAELSPAERQELQNKVTALMAMLDQVDRRYRHYQHQMQMVVSSFDAVAGAGAARPYTALALQTISRHFRSLRDAIGAQVQSARRSLGEQDGGSGAQGGGGLSRLRYIDQHLRQQRAMQQFGMMQQPQHAWRPQRGLPESAVSVLRAWLFEHFLHPYPKDSEKLMLARQAGLSRGQVSNWFINARVRLWKPMVEEMYKEEFGAEMDSNSSSENAGKQGKDEAISSDQDRDEFQSPSSAATRHAGASQLSPYKTEPVVGMDAVAGGGVGMSSLDGVGAMGAYAAGLSLNRHGPGGAGGGSGLMQDAFAHHGVGDDARFVAYGDMADLGGSVSLTLGLQHCNNNNNNASHVPAEQQALLYGNAGDFDFLNGSDDRQRFGSSSQLLHDFVT